jgi:hypothetical protein
LSCSLRLKGPLTAMAGGSTSPPCPGRRARVQWLTGWTSRVHRRVRRGVVLR